MVRRRDQLLERSKGCLWLSLLLFVLSAVLFGAGEHGLAATVFAVFAGSYVYSHALLARAYDPELDEEPRP